MQARPRAAADLVIVTLIVTVIVGYSLPKPEPTTPTRAHPPGVR